MRLEGNCEYLMGLATLQDSLLQTYRTILIYIETIFVTIGIGLAVAVVTLDKFPKLTLQRSIVLLFLLLFAFCRSVVARKMLTIIDARGKDVSIVHRIMIENENGLPAEKRYFTQLKIEQLKQRMSPGIMREIEEKTMMFLSNRIITCEFAELLVRGGLTHTRKPIDIILKSAPTKFWNFMVIAGFLLVFYDLCLLFFYRPLILWLKVHW